MKKKFGVRTNGKIILRISIAFLVVMIPIYLLGLYIYQWGQQTVTSEISKSSMAQVQFNLTQLEQEIERIKILQYDCLNDENLNNLAIRYPIMSNYKKVRALQELQTRLYTIENSSRYVMDVSAFIVPLEQMISSSSGLDALDWELFENIRGPENTIGAQLIFFEERLFLSTIQANKPTYRNNLYMIIVELNPRALEDALGQFVPYQDSGSYYINAQGRIIASSINGTAIPPSELIESYQQLRDSGTVSNQINYNHFFSVYHFSDYLNILLLRYLPQNLVLTPLKDFSTWVWIFTIVSFFVIVIFAIYTYHVVHKPMDKLVRAFKKVENGELNITIEGHVKNEFSYLYMRFNDMVSSLQTLINQVFRQKLLRQRAELKQLQSQINPHFLYNSLFIINTMAKLGDENLVPFTKYLGEYFRYVTRNSADYVPLAAEIDHARTYTSIQDMRFSKSLSLEFEVCPQQFAKKEVPRLILQPIVENAFEHAVEKKKSNAIVKVSFVAQADCLQIITEDNGSDFTEKKLAEMRKMLEDERDDIETTGLLNVYRRMRLIYDNEACLQFSRSELGGLCVTLLLDFGKGRNQ